MDLTNAIAKAKQLALLLQLSEFLTALSHHPAKVSIQVAGTRTNLDSQSQIGQRLVEAKGMQVACSGVPVQRVHIPSKCFERSEICATLT